MLKEYEELINDIFNYATVFRKVMITKALFKITVLSITTRR